MLPWRSALLHVVVLALFGSAVVATPFPLNLAAIGAWGVVVREWGRRRSRPDRKPGVHSVSVIQVVGMAAMVLAAALVPVKVLDRQESRQITLPKRVMTLSELSEPVAHGWSRFDSCTVRVPEGLADQAVRFPSRELTVGEFIAAIEVQTPLRHRFHHCGNGATILWGGDCSFGLHFRAPVGPETPDLAGGWHW